MMMSHKFIKHQNPIQSQNSGCMIGAV
jgi:hypothetical protein